MIRVYLSLLIVSCFIGIAHGSRGDESCPDGLFSERGERGSFWRCVDVRVSTPTVTTSTKEVVKEAERDDEKDCDNNWEVDCGFMRPKDFEQQEVMRDALLQSSVMEPTSDSVLQFQRYLYWVLGQGKKYRQIWELNIAQDSELSNWTKPHMGRLALRLNALTRQDARSEFYNFLRIANARLFYFTRSDCSYCHAQVGSVLSVAANMDIDVVNVSFDDACLHDLLGADSKCYSAQDGRRLGFYAGVDIVPVLALFMPTDPTDDSSLGDFIKISHGVEPSFAIEDRLQRFMSHLRDGSARGFTQFSDGVTKKGEDK